MCIRDRRRSGQALCSALLGLVRNNRMHGDGALVVHPENFFSAQIAVQCGHKATRRRRTLLGADARQLPVADARDGAITPRQAEQRGGGAAAPRSRPSASNTKTLASVLSTIANGMLRLSPESTTQSATCQASWDARSIS